MAVLPGEVADCFLVLRRGLVSLEEPSAEAPAISSWARFVAHFRAPRYEPPLLPIIAVEFMALSQDPSVADADIMKVAERDPLLAAKVLRRAQRTPGAARRPARSLSEAAALLGSRGLRDILFEISLNIVKSCLDCSLCSLGYLLFNLSNLFNI